MRYAYAINVASRDKCAINTLPLCHERAITFKKRATIYHSDAINMLWPILVPK